MSTTTIIAIIPKQRMRQLYSKYGGYTESAWAEVNNLPLYGDGEVLKRRPKAGGQILDDGRAVATAVTCLQLAYSCAIANREDHRTTGGLLLSLCFFMPLVGHVAFPRFNDAGPGAEPRTSILGRPRCQHLLECWRAVERQSFCVGVDKALRLWNPAINGNLIFNGALLLEYLDSFASCLEEAISHGAFYTMTSS